MNRPIVFLQRALLLGIRAGIVLLLLTPFVISENTVYPFVVGKALYSRAIIEVVFALWVLLLCFNPAVRPPRSWLLIVLALGFAWAVVTAGFGVSPQRSLWSSYERMSGLVDAVHWLALVIVVASVLRTPRDLRILLGLNLCASVLVALLAVASSLQIDPILYGVVWERSYPRIGTVFGNSAYLGAYASINFAVALGFLARSLFRYREVSYAVDSVRHVRIGRQLTGTPLGRWALRLLLALVAALQFWALSLSGSLAAVAGVLGAAAFLAVALMVTQRLRKKLIAPVLGVIAAGVVAGVMVAAPFSTPSEATDHSLAAANPLLERLRQEEVIRSYRARESAWKAGIAAFAEKPWLGWGTENFIVAFGRHATGVPAEGHVHDQAHNELIEKAVAEGSPGLAIHLTLWALALCFVIRAARAEAPRDQALTLAVGAALAGHFFVNQWQFDSAALKLQVAFLFAYAIGLEMSVAGERPRLPEIVRRAASLVWRAKALMAVLAVGGVALAVGGLASNRAIHAAATAFLHIQPGQPDYIERTIAAFPPLATEPRRHLLTYVARDWENVHAHDETKAQQLLADADAQARAAIAAEPANWRVRRAAARMYLAVATTEPFYRPVAALQAETALALAPNL